MNPTLLEILAFTLAIIIGLTLLLIGARMAVGEAKEEEVIEEVDAETEMLKERLKFLQDFYRQADRMEEQKIESPEKCKADRDYVEQEVKKIEGRLRETD